MHLFYKLPFGKLFFNLFLVASTPFCTKAQQATSGFSALGSAIYKDKIAELDKYTVPKKYSEKSAQAWYDEILTERKKALLGAFKDDDVIYDTLLLNKCNSIFNRIKASNPKFKFDTIKLYINRSVVANAANYGEGTVMVNSGLFLWVDNDDELALVLGHEMAHQLLDHFGSRVDKSITTLTSDEFKEELKKIKKADYGKFERFRNLMKGVNIESGKHSVYKESEADSLGVQLARNAGFNTTNGSKILLKLDKVDDLFVADKLYTLKDFVEKAPIDLSYFKPRPKYNGLSKVNITMNADKDFDSIKTHPDCIKRFESIAGKGNAATINCCSTLNDQYKIYKENAMLEIVRYLYENGSIGYCTHFCLFALKNNYDPAIYNYFLSLCFSKLYFKDKNLERFNAANAAAKRGSTLKDLQDFLFEMGSNDLATLSAWYLNYKPGANSEDFEFANLMYNVQVKAKDKEAAYADFMKKFPNNKYLYLIQKKSK